MHAVTTQTTHNTAQTQLVEAVGVEFAYRRFGRPSELPLVMLQHFRGNLDNWDPALTDALATEREVILVDYPGVGASRGEFGPTIADTARQMIAFIAALGLDEIDLLGFSIGGFVAQEIALLRPSRGGSQHSWRDNGYPGRGSNAGGIMTNETTTTVSTPRAPELVGQIVVVIGGSAGIGLETARRARAEGADVVLAARNPERLEQAALELGAQSTATFDANDPASLERFFEDLPTPIDHVMVTGGGPHHKPPLEMDTEEARAALGEHMLLALAVARNARGRVRPAGSVVFIGGTAGRRIRPGLEIVSAVTAGMPALTASLALELAPIRVNLIAPGFVDTPLSASLLGDDLDRRREELRSTLPIGRVVGPADVAALAVHLMINTAVTGCDIRHRRRTAVRRVRCDRAGM